MGVAALVLGIISLIIGFIPFCGMIAFVPAIIGVILGIVEIVNKSKKSESKGMGIAGLVLSVLAIVIMIWWLFIAGVGLSNLDVNELANQVETNMNNYTYNDYDEYDF